MGHAKLHIANDQGSFVDRNAALKSAANEWANGLKEETKQKLSNVGEKADVFVHEHPGRFIVGACALGLAAGFLLARRTKQ